MQRPELLIAIAIVIGFSLVLTGTVSATLDSYYLDVANVDSSLARNHTHIITFSGTLNVTIPAIFSIQSTTGSPNISGTNIEWFSGPQTTVQLVTQLNGSCTEGQTWDTNIYINNTLQDYFRMLCVDDANLVSLKFENGHGESAWLDEPYFTFPFTVYTLIRVFEHGNYFDNEVGKDAEITCSVPDDIFISGKFTSSCGSGICNITKTWDELDTSLFRVWAFSQLTNYSIGSEYTVNCSNVTWNFTHEGILATLGNNYLESRTTEPFTFTASNTDRILNYTITNSESYTAYDLFLTFFIEGVTYTRELVKLDSGESESFLFDIDDDSVAILDADFIPSWEYNSLSPVHYQQNDTYDYTLRPTGGMGGSSNYSGFICEPELISSTTDVSIYKIKCYNYDNIDYGIDVHLSGDLRNITEIVDENGDYTFLLKKHSLEYFTAEFDYSKLPQLSYSGTIYFNSTDVTSVHLTAFNIVQGVNVSISDLQRFITLISGGQITSSAILFANNLNEPGILLPKGYIPTWFILLIILVIILLLLRWKRKELEKQRKKLGILFYILFGLLLTLLTTVVVFT